MSYDLSINRRAQKQINRLPAEIRQRVRRSVLDLAQNPRPAGTRRLQGRAGWRIRIGDYRAIYEIDDERRVIEVLNVAHRRESYR